MLKKFVVINFLYIFIIINNNLLDKFFFIYIFLILLLIISIFFIKKINFNVVFYTFINIFYILFFLSVLIKSIFKNSLFLDINFLFIKCIFNSNFFLINFELDNLSLFYSLTTIQITFFVNIFSFFYNKKELRKVQFFYLLNAFSISMVLLFLSKNFVLVFFFESL